MVPSWKKAPVCQTCTKHMRGVAKMLEYKQKRNNGRTLFAGVYKFECECVCVCVCVHAEAFAKKSRTEKIKPSQYLVFSCTP